MFFRLTGSPFLRRFLRKRTRNRLRPSSSCRENWSTTTGSCGKSSTMASHASPRTCCAICSRAWRMSGRKSRASAKGWWTAWREASPASLRPRTLPPAPSSRNLGRSPRWSATDLAAPITSPRSKTRWMIHLWRKAAVLWGARAIIFRPVPGTAATKTAPALRPVRQGPTAPPERLEGPPAPGATHWKGARAPASTCCCRRCRTWGRARRGSRRALMAWKVTIRGTTQLLCKHCRRSASGKATNQAKRSCILKECSVQLTKSP